MMKKCMMKKRFLSFLLSACMVFALLPVSALAAGDFVEKDGVLVQYTGKGGDVVIPDGFTKIEMSAFNGCDVLTGVTIPGSVDLIGSFAFTYCTSLTSVSILPGVRVISAYAFKSCDGLIRVSIPSSVTRIGGGAFLGCNALTDVYYEGSEEQWNAIRISTENVKLKNATIHYNSSMPDTPLPSTPSAPVYDDIAYVSTQTVTLDGKSVEFQAYALKNENGNASNFIKLRDMAYYLNGTKAQFSVGWSAAQGITLTTGKSYTSDGSELSTPFSGDRSYIFSDRGAIIDGKTVGMESITLADDDGNGYTYYKIRDLGKALGFNVSWYAESGIVIDTNEPYSEGN